MFSQRTISGTVTGPDGDEIMAAIVSIKGTSVFTETDFDGNYSIEALPEDILMFSYAGYETQEVKVGNQLSIIIILEVQQGYIICFHCPYSKTSFIYNVNYQTVGLKYTRDHIPFMKNSAFRIEYSTGFKANSNFNLEIRKYVRFDYDFDLDIKAQFETSDFNEFQYHSYKLNLGKSIKLFSDQKFEQIQLITGYINYDGMSSSNNFGYGVGFEKSLIYNFKVGTSFIHWQEFNEFNANASYTWRRWSISGNYKQLSDYEEFQVGLGYNFYF